MFDKKCDRCGKQYAINNPVTIDENVDPVAIDQFLVYTPENDLAFVFDFCDDCVADFLRFMKGE